MKAKSAIFAILTVLLSGCGNWVQGCQNLPKDYPHSSPKIICNKAEGATFARCIRKNFPIGTPVKDLREYLISDDFKIIHNQQERHYWMKWSCHDFANHSVLVNAWYDDDGDIIKYSAFPAEPHTTYEILNHDPKYKTDMRL